MVGNAEKIRLLGDVENGVVSPRFSTLDFRPIFFHMLCFVEMEKIVENFGENVETLLVPFFYLVELMFVMIALTVSA